ncbi:MAG: DUF5335 family protein [Longimicrobiales bacterium]
MSETTKIPQDQLSEYFETFTKRFLRDDAPEVVTVDVMAPDLGDQLAAAHARLVGITYDRGTNALEFELAGGDHRVVAPKEVWTVQEDDGFLSAIEVVRADGVREVATVTRNHARPRD